MENASTEVYLSAHSALVKEGADHLSVVIFTKYNIDTDKPVLVLNTPPVSFIGVPTSQGITGSIQRSCDP